MTRLKLFKKYLLILLFVANGIFVEGGRKQAETEKPIPVKYDEGHRGIQWCVNGVDEPEFQRYPFNEFKPMLRRTYYEPFSANVRFKYTVDLRPVKIKAGEMAVIGTGGNLYQRAHFVFKARLRREFLHDVKVSYNDTKIEGLLVQVNYAPLGVGLPTGEFVHPNEFNCVDCKKPIGIPVACRKRTYFHSVHPTLLAFHHKMKVPGPELERRKNFCLGELIPSQCIITDFHDIQSQSASGAGAAGAPPSQEPGEDAKIPQWDWKTKLEKHWHQPHPEMTVPCKSKADCNEQFENWFRSRCCQNEKDGVCGKGEEASATGASADRPAPPPPPSVPDTCPNKGMGADTTVYATSSRQSKVYPTFECRPYQVSVCRPPGHALTQGWETERDLEIDYTKPPAPSQPSSGPPAPPTFNRFSTDQQCCLQASPGEPCPPPPAQVPGQPPPPPQGKIVCPKPDPSQGIVKTECIQRIVLPYNQETNEEVPEPDPSPCENVVGEYFGTTSEVHGNLVWYFPPCYYSSRVRFLMLVVHSFSKGIYSIVESDDYYDLKSGAQNSNQGRLNPAIPSPLFTGFPHVCEALSNLPHYLYTKTYQDTPFDYSRSYDECIQKTGDDIRHQSCPGIPKFAPFVPRKKPGKPSSKPVGVIDSQIPKCDENLVPVNYKPTPCENTCPALPQTTVKPVTAEGAFVIKRSLHGGINIVTNFCIMPICVFIARFYKETYNLESFKGMRKWYWMHMVGSGGSTVLMYMGFFTKRLVNTRDDHSAYGHLYIVCLGISYLTAWIRHKKRIIGIIVESIHVGSGYACFLLALVCVTNAKHNEVPISDAVKMVVYVAISSLALFYIGMTIHICSLDKKFGMNPRRWHFPTVESRFEDLPVPGRNVRRFFLIAVLFINLPLTLSTLFL